MTDLPTWAAQLIEHERRAHGLTQEQRERTLRALTAALEFADAPSTPEASSDRVVVAGPSSAKALKAALARTLGAGAALARKRAPAAAKARPLLQGRAHLAVVPAEPALRAAASERRAR